MSSAKPSAQAVKPLSASGFRSTQDIHTMEKYARGNEAACGALGTAKDIGQRPVSVRIVERIFLTAIPL
jgi:hypothetical protein